MRKKAFETTVMVVLLFASPMLIAVKIETADALTQEYYNPDTKWWLAGHNWVFLNGLELLRKDGFTDEADMAEKYLKDVVNGLCDADRGPIRLGEYGDLQPDDLLGIGLDMTDLGGTGKNGGGFSHMFDPWSHLATGVTEDPWGCFAIGLMVGGIGGPTVPAWTSTIMARVKLWADWFGKDACTAAEKAFNRACEAWNADYQQKAMYYLGMVLHLIGDEAGVPYHSANLLMSGHDEYETWVHNDLNAYLGAFNDWKTAVECGKNPGETGTIYNINWSKESDSLDHGIYLESLKDRSDGIYIAGDPVMTDDDGNIYGHIYQLSHPAAQFIDFAGHESWQWLPLVNPDTDEGDMDSWWETPNWIEAGHGDLHMINSTKARDSRLIFHLNDAYRIIADFEGADHNWEAIDMESSWGTRLGYVEAYNGHSLNDRVGGPWTDEGWLYGGPEPNAPDGTLQIRTVVDKGLEGDYWDDDCDGWQIAEMTYLPRYGANGIVVDPLYHVKMEDVSNRAGYQYVTTDGHIGHLKDRLWDDPVPPPVWDSRNDRWDNPRPENVAVRTAAIHLLDLSSKLCAGMIKSFFDEVHLPINIPPKTWIFAVDTYDYPYNLEHTRTYVGPSGEVYTTNDELGIAATIGHTVWNDTLHMYVYEKVEDNVLYQIHFAIDGVEHTWSIPDYLDDPLYNFSLRLPTVLRIPDDGKPHTITCHGTGYNRQSGQPVDEFPGHLERYVVDRSPPTVTLTVGEPSRLIDGVWHVTADTPITVTPSDGNGSGVKGFYYYITYRDYGPMVVPSEGEKGSIENCLTYLGPFTLGGKEVTRPILASMRPVGTTGIWDVSYSYLKAITRELFLGLEPGDYEIGYFCADHLGYLESKGGVRQEVHAGQPIWVHEDGFHITLDDFIEGVDLKIDPYIQSVQPGSSRTYNISVTNNYEVINTYDVTLDGLDPTWYTLPSQITLEPRQTENVTLTVSPPYECLILKAYSFNVTASMQKTVEFWEPWERDTQEGVLPVFSIPKDPELPGSVSIDGSKLITGLEPGVTLETSFQMKNLDGRDNCIRLEIDVDNIAKDHRPTLSWFNWTRLDLFIPAGQTATIPLRIDVPKKAGFHQPMGRRFFDLKSSSLYGFPETSDTCYACLSPDFFLWYPIESLPGLHREEIPGVCNQTVVGQGYPARVRVLVGNLGSITQSFNVTAFANDAPFQTIPVLKLASGNTTVLEFLWNTTGKPRGGVYNITATLTLPEYEVTELFNVIQIVMAGDVDANRIVDIRDLALMAKIWQISYPDPRFRPNCDIDANGKIDIRDLSVAAKNFRKTG